MAFALSDFDGPPAQLDRHFHGVFICCVISDHDRRSTRECRRFHQTAKCPAFIGREGLGFEDTFAVLNLITFKGADNDLRLAYEFCFRVRNGAIVEGEDLSLGFDPSAGIFSTECRKGIHEI